MSELTVVDLKKLPSPVVRLNTKHEGRSVAVKYWTCVDAAHRTDDNARIVKPFPVSKAYIRAKDLMTSIAQDDTTSCCEQSPLYLFVSDPNELDINQLPEIKPADIFSLQSGLTIFTIQVVPVDVNSLPTVVRSYLQLQGENTESTNFTLSQLRVGSGSLRYWDEEFQGYVKIVENEKVPVVPGKPLSLLLEQKVTGAMQSTSEVTLHKAMPRGSYASIFSRLVDHQTLSTVVHCRTDNTDWQSASKALQLGFLTAKKGRADKALKKLLWNGVPHMYRRGFWLAMSGGLATLRANPRSYDAALAKVVSHKDKYLSSSTAAAVGHSFNPDATKVPFFGCEWDPHTQSISNVSYNVLNKEGQRQAKVLLCVIQETHPQITHCPSLAILCCILLLFMSAEEAYATLACLLHLSSMGGYPWFFRTNVVENDWMVGWFEGLIRVRYSLLHSHLQRLKFDLKAMLHRWFFKFFSEDLPFYGTLQVIDIFLAEGCSALYKVALALIIWIEKPIMECKSATDIEEYLEHAYSTLNADELLFAAYKMDVPLSDIPFSDKSDRELNVNENIPVLYDPTRAEQGGIDPDLASGAKRHFLHPLKGRQPSTTATTNPFAPLPAIGTAFQPNDAWDTSLVPFDANHPVNTTFNQSSHHASLVEVEVEDDVIIESEDDEPSPQSYKSNNTKPILSKGRLLEYNAPTVKVDPSEMQVVVRPSRSSNVSRSLESRRTRSLGHTNPFWKEDTSGAPILLPDKPPSVREVAQYLSLNDQHVQDPDEWRLSLPASSPYLYNNQSVQHHSRSNESGKVIHMPSKNSPPSTVVVPNTSATQKPASPTNSIERRNSGALVVSSSNSGALQRVESSTNRSGPLALRSQSPVSGLPLGVTDPESRSASHPKSLMRPSHISDLRRTSINNGQESSESSKSTTPPALGFTQRLMIDAPVPESETQPTETTEVITGKISPPLMPHAPGEKTGRRGSFVRPLSIKS